MTIGITTDPFKPTGSISFGDIAARYGKPASQHRNIKASDYLRDTSALGNDDTKPVKNATENSAVVTSTDDAWSVGDLRNTIKSYVVTHTDDSEEFNATSNANLESIWNDNLDKNIKKTFNLDNDSYFYSDEVGKYALEFNADMRNLTISIAGSVYGASGDGGESSYANGGDGGDALYVNNSYTADGNVLVKINQNGRILAGGGGGGGGGDSPNKTLFCDRNEDVSFNVKSYVESKKVTYPRGGGRPTIETVIFGSKVQRDSYNFWNKHCAGSAPNEPEVFGNRPDFPSGTPNAVNYVIANERGNTRGRCRGSKYRSKDGAYTCCDLWNVTCRGTFDDSLTATGGTGGTGGRGAGYSDQIRSAQGGVEGNPGEKINCVNRSTSATTVAGGDGGDGGSYGQRGDPGGLEGGEGGAGGKSILYKNVSIIGRKVETVKGDIVELS